MGCNEILFNWIGITIRLNTPTSEAIMLLTEAIRDHTYQTECSVCKCTFARFIFC